MKKQEAQKKKTAPKSKAQPPAPPPKKLTHKVIKQLSIYYGLAIRRYPDSVEKMEKEALAALYHNCSTDAKPQHHYCPSGEDSWCKWQQAQAKNEKYRHPAAFDDETFSMLKPIYDDLTSHDLLKRCLGSNTQNNNESLNQTVWRIAPKHTFNGLKVTEIAGMLAVCTFNEGCMPLITIMDVMGINIGQNALNFGSMHDSEKLFTAEKRSSDASKEGRIERKKAKLAHEQELEDAEGTFYQPGFAD